MAIGLAGLRATRLAHIGAKPFAERNQLLHVRAHLVSDPHNHLEVGAYTGPIAGLLHLLQIAIAVRNRAGLLVKICGRQNDIRQRGRLSEEHLLHHDKGILQRRRIDPITRNRIRPNHIQRRKLAPPSRLEYLQHVEAGFDGSIVLAEGTAADRRITGKHIRQQAHVGCATRIDVVGEQRKLRTRQRQSKLDQLPQVSAAQLGTNQDQQILFTFDRITERAERTGINCCAGSRSLIASQVTRPAHYIRTEQAAQTLWPAGEA